MWSYEITYNHLNLPKKIVFDTGEITYLYDATGVKLKKTVTDGNTSQITNTHYSEGFQYTEDHLDFFPHAEGYVNVIDYSAFNYVYTYKDHLGNIRLKYTLDPDTNETAILEENHYYPYGLTHQGYNADHKFLLAIDEIIELVEVTSIMDDKYKYKFNGMEWQDELDLNHYDFGARNYDAALGRTFTPDPLGEVFYHLSPYSFLNNNPLNSIDPTGALTLEGQAAIDYFQQLKDEIASKPRKRKEEEYEDDIKEDSNANSQGQEDCEVCEEIWNGIKSGTKEVVHSLSAGEVARAERALDIYYAEGINAYLYQSIGDAHYDEMVAASTGMHGTVRNVRVNLGAAKTVTAPKGWITKASGKGGGVKFVDPKNPHNQIRQMPGNPNSSFPAQQNPYIKYMKDGKFYDVKGNPLPSGNIPEAHIPSNQFNINNMPKF